jgi:hypothetical protein
MQKNRLLDSVDARTDFIWPICGSSEDNAPHIVQKAQSPAFSEENKTPEYVPTGRQAIG